MRKMFKMIQLSEFDAIFQEREGQEEKQMGEECWEENKFQEKDAWWGGGLDFNVQTFPGFRKQPGREYE